MRHDMIDLRMEPPNARSTLRGASAETWNVCMGVGSGHPCWAASKMRRRRCDCAGCIPARPVVSLFNPFLLLARLSPEPRAGRHFATAELPWQQKNNPQPTVRMEVALTELGSRAT